MKNLESNKSYLNAGNTFSKLLLLKSTLPKNGSLIVVSSEKALNQYIKIADYLHIKINQLKSISDLCDLVYNKAGIFIVVDSFFHASQVSLAQVEKNLSFQILKNTEYVIDDITKKLNEYGYKYNSYAESGTFQVVGDILSIHDFSGNMEYKVSFWGESVEEILVIDKKEGKNDITGILKVSLDHVTIGKHLLIETESEANTFHSELEQKLIDNHIFVVTDSLDFYKYSTELKMSLENYIHFDSFQDQNISQENLGIQDLFLENIEDFKALLEKDSPQEIHIYTKSKTAVERFAEYNNLYGIHIHETELNTLKSFMSVSNITICDDNISRIFVKKRIKRNLSKSLDLLLQIKPGDYIVHVDHGIGVFTQILEKTLPGQSGKVIRKEYIELEYKNNDKLFVPITEISRINKYVGAENPKLTGLSTKEWEKKIQKASGDIEDIAQDLLNAFAKRKFQKGFAFQKMPTEESKFANSFEYVYTDDQLKVIHEIFEDMEKVQPMDRLVSGDVGFGKTEIAFNAINKAIINGKQAALISPLVVLAYEHYEKAQSRFEDFPYNIEVITRFEKPANIKNTLERLKNGKIDLIIGTHRLLSEDIEFKHLGLLVIDEEHKFGVKDKEKIKNLKGTIDILSLSATPIPRSLNMALNGIKSMSMLTMAPVGRQAIHTMVSKFDEQLIKQAGDREFERGGQIFFIHNRVQSIDSMKTSLSQIFPGKKIIIAHGQLSGDLLEQRILAFKRKEYDILLATTVIENGIDFSNVNTIFINDAYRFGISQIHQLRGRVGRSDKQGYCYLLFRKDKIQDDAAKRLKTIVDYSHLGAGFELAMKDLEVRGGGDLLGIKQSGQSSEIGVNLFLEMLEDKIEELKRTGPTPPLTPPYKGGGQIDPPPCQGGARGGQINTTIDLNVSAFIEDSYFSSELDKINFYREIESLQTLEDLQNIISDFKDINKDLPLETETFFDMLELKIRAGKYRIIHIRKLGINYQVEFHSSLSTEELKKFLALDTEVHFTLNTIHKIRTETKKYTGEGDFIKYMLDLLRGLGKKTKIKLKKKI